MRIKVLKVNSGSNPYAKPLTTPGNQRLKFKVLLITIYGNTSYMNSEEIGIASIAAVLRENGYEVMLTGGPEYQIDYNRISDFKPDVIGGPVYHDSKDEFYKFCIKMKNKLPQVYICAGGYTSTYNHQEMMEEAEFIDFIIRGEGEFAFLELISQLEQGKDLAQIKGLTYRNGGDIIVNENRALIPDINILPIPVRDYLLEKKLKIAVISTSRGCKANCSFCVARSFWKKWRGRDIEKVLDEIEYLYQLGVRYIDFIDSSFEDPDANCERISRIARGICARKIDISYFADVRADFYKKATPDLMNLLIKSGLRVVLVGVEAGNEFDLKLYGKKATLQDNQKCIEFLRGFNIRVRIGFINFNPYSTFNRLRENIDYLEKYNFAEDYFYIASRYALEKGGRLYQKINQDGLLKEGKYDQLFNYDFLDPRIETLCTYITHQLKLINIKAKGAISRISNYHQMYIDLLADLKRKLEKKQDKRAFNLVQTHETEMENILLQVNKKNASSSRELLSLAESQWDKKYADEIMNRFLSETYLLTIVDTLKTKRSEFLNKIRSYDQGAFHIIKMMDDFFI